MPENWVQHPVVNTEEGSNPDAPLAWGSPENPDDAVAGYGYVAADTSEVEETFYYHSDHLGSTAYITDKDANITTKKTFVQFYYIDNSPKVQYIETTVEKLYLREKMHKSMISVVCKS